MLEEVQKKVHGGQKCWKGADLNELRDAGLVLRK